MLRRLSLRPFATPSLQNASRHCRNVWTSSAAVQSHKLTFETGKIATVANGSVVLSLNNAAAVHCTVVRGIELQDRKSNSPLSISISEPAAAVNRIPRGFKKSEHASTEREVKQAVLLEKIINPLLPEGYLYETQIQSTVLHSDRKSDPDVLAINAASAALLLAEAPLSSPFAAVRVSSSASSTGITINPSFDQQATSSLNLLVVATRNGLLLVEGSCSESTESKISVAIESAFTEIQEILDAQESLVAQKVSANSSASSSSSSSSSFAPLSAPSEHMLLATRGLCFDEHRAAMMESQPAQSRQLDEVSHRSYKQLQHLYPRAPFQILYRALDLTKREAARSLMLEGFRSASRSAHQIRSSPSSSVAGYIPQLHGSSLVQLGQTQAISSLTLGDPSESQDVDNVMGGRPGKRFMAQVSIPSYSSNALESRQESHDRINNEMVLSNCLENAFASILPSANVYPFSLRVDTSVLSNDGSGLSACISATSLALWDAGVQIPAMAGLTLSGLLPSSSSASPLLLTDCSEWEESFADFSLQVGATQKGFTMILMSNNNGSSVGIPLSVASDALNCAKEGIDTSISTVLMAPEGLSAPRSPARDIVPRVTELTIDPRKAGVLIGPGGANIKSIQETCECRIVVDQSLVRIYAQTDAALAAAQELVLNSVSGGADSGRGQRPPRNQEPAEPAAPAAPPMELEVGQEYKVTVVSIKDFGIFVSPSPSNPDGFIHISDLALERIRHPSDVVEVGQEFKAQCLSLNDKGRVKFSRKALLEAPGRRQPRY